MEPERVAEFTLSGDFSFKNFPFLYSHHHSAHLPHPFAHHKRSTILIAGVVGALVVLALLYLLTFLRSSNSFFSYSSAESCTSNLVMFPGMHKFSSTSGDFKIEPKDKLTLFGKDIASRSVCVTAIKEPAANTNNQFEIKSSLVGFMSKSLNLETAELPQLTKTPDINKTIPTVGNVEFELDKSAQIFSYELTANGNSSACTESEAANSISCPTKPLQFEQSQQYSIVLNRHFNDSDSKAVYTDSFKTAAPVSVSASSITNEQLIYTKPRSLEITFNKAIAELGEVKLTNLSTDKPVEIKSELTDRKLVISFAKDLSRSNNFELTIESAEANDQGWMPQPYSLKFTTSGGPQVISSNIDPAGFLRSGNVTLNFDVGLNSGQDINKLISLSAGGKAANFSATSSGSTITVNPNENFGFCQSFTVTLAAGLDNQYDVPTTSGSSYSGRTACYTTETIGYSVNGRAITAYKFGTGGKTIMFTGATHGDEPSSKYILDSLVDDINLNYNNLPSTRSVIVVPNINPDGIAAGTRTNSKSIDLNRNFPANNWKKDVVMPGGQLVNGGGGQEPLDQPESKAIADYTLSINPALVVNYHATGGLAIYNGSGNSASLANSYGSQVGYQSLSSSQANGVFDHDTTGAYSDWLHDDPGIPTLLIELWSYTANEFSSHRAAMWSMINS